MHIQHPKSVCCRAPIRRYGVRRRQCTVCLRTWRIYRKKRGRKRRRIDKKIFKRIFAEQLTIIQQQKLYRKISLHGLYKRVQRATERLTNQPLSPPKLSGPLCLIADAFWYRFAGEIWTLYLMVLKPVNSSLAYLLDPLVLPGGESYENWEKAIESIDHSLRGQIKAFVSDDFRASQRLVEKYGWIHQLCHFHLIAYLQVRRGKRKSSIFGITIREKVYQDIREALETSDRRRLGELKKELIRLANKKSCPRSIRMIIHEFLRKIDSYRAYQNHPELHLPHTTNAVESVGKIIKRISRNLQTPSALRRWVIALVRFRQVVKCNGKELNKNQPN